MLDNYSLEIDFLPVGDGSRSGDAITLRFGIVENSIWKTQTVFVIDGGNSQSGNQIVEHINMVYKTNKVDRIILTHPDADHASGLRNVIEKMEVGKVWMHCPWNHWEDVKDSMIDGRITKSSFGDRMREAYQFAHDVEQLAIKKNIEIYPPHQGCSFNVNGEKVVTVLGPSKQLYTSLIQASGKTPEMAIFESTRNFSAENKKVVFEDMSFETENLAEGEIPTSAENDMSLILLLNIAGTRVLFTGDSGTQGLYKAILYSAAKNISLKNLDLFDVPHHGSRRNLSKGILKHINAKYSIISCAAKGAPKHPSPIVTNALLRRNMNSYVTQGKMLTYHSKNLVARPGVNPVSPVSFQNTLEISI